MRKRVLLTSTWILRGGLVEKREEVEAIREKRERESDGMKKRVNTRRSAMVIMKAPTKLETPPLLISSRFTYVDCILQGWTPRISLSLEDLELCHIYLVRNVLCADARTRGDNRFLRGDSEISIRSDSYSPWTKSLISRLANLFVGQWIAVCFDKWTRTEK